jgi:formylglycine-generating enzyme required for sulfatase activity
MRGYRLAMRTRNFPARACVLVILLAGLLTLLLLHPLWLPLSRTAQARSPQGKGGEIKPKAAPASKPVPAPKPVSAPKPAPAPKPSTRIAPRPAPRAPAHSAGRSPDLSGLIELVKIPAGSFMMGSAYGDSGEQPVHQVTISEEFYMGKYEVTQAQWQAVMGSNPSGFSGTNLPVENVSWNDASAFITKLNAKSDNYTYRLPTEAEWEYAARAGATVDYAGDLDALAWYGNNSGRQRLDAAAIFRTEAQNYSKRITENGGQTHAIGSKLPNAFGLFDMQGNVWEWCQDWYHDSYAGAPTDGSAWLSGGEQKYRVLRGGSWYDNAIYLRAASRLRLSPAYRTNSDGLRVVAVART